MRLNEFNQRLFEDRKHNGGVIIFNETHIYLICEEGKIRDFGGKSEVRDTCTWETACREFREESSITSGHPIRRKLLLRKESVRFITEIMNPYYYVFYIYSPEIAARLGELKLSGSPGADMITSVPIKELRVRKTGYPFCFRMNGTHRQHKLNIDVYSTLKEMAAEATPPPINKGGTWGGWRCPQKKQNRIWDFTVFPFLNRHGQVAEIVKNKSRGDGGEGNR